MPSQQVQLLRLNAKRIMGLEPAKWRRPGGQVGICSYETRLLPLGHLQRNGDDHTNLYGEYLLPPEGGGDIYNYAIQLIALEWPVTEIWYNGLPLLVRINELQELED